jgi:RHS repeat-associated protein
MSLPRLVRRCRVTLVAAAACLSFCAASGRAGERPLEELRELDGALVRLATATAQSRAAEMAAVKNISDRMGRRHARKLREFELGAGRKLPPKAAERLAAARAAFEAGDGRLLELLRAILAQAGGEGGDPGPLVSEARSILEKTAEAARKDPISADSKIRAPDITAPALRQGSGTVTGTDAALGPVPGVLKQAAAQLAGPVEAYEWVRNGIRPEFYHGAMKGPLQTYLEGSGNDVDTASVLIALLRAKGIPARYVRGTAEVAGNRLAAVTGTLTAEQAARVLQRAGIPHEEPSVAGGGIGSVKLARTWVEAFVPYANYRGALIDAQGKLWIPLDPGFKELEAPRGIDVVRDLGFDPRTALDDYLAAPGTTTPLEFVRDRVKSLLPPDTPYADALNSRGHAAESLGILPSSLPYKVAGSTDVSYDVPEELHHTVRLMGEANGVTILDATFPAAELLGRRLTLSYVPFDDEDERTVRLYGGLSLTPPYLIEVKPVLKSSGVVVAAGTAGVGAGVKYALRLELGFPGGSETIGNSVIAGNMIAIGLGGRQVTAGESSPDRAAEILAGLAWRYLDGWNQSDEELANLLRVVPVRPTLSACFVMSDVQVEYAGGDPLYPVTFDWKGIAIDADLRSSAPVGLESRDTEKAFLLVSGLQGSVLEHRVFEEGLGIESVSTAKVLQLARSQGTPVLDLTRDTVEAALPALPFDAAVKEEIRSAAERGFLARVPAAAVAHLAWAGVGYLLLDEETGEAAYQLQGGHSGGTTAPTTLQIPESVRDALIDQGEEPAPEDSEVVHIIKFATTDFQEGTVDRPLAKPLKVLATDAEGFRVPGATVIFSVIGGGGQLVDPATGRPSDGDLAVRANDRGEAEATLVLGRRTDPVPRYVCQVEAGCSAETDTHLEQVGLNLVTARAGTATLAEPFTGIGFADDQFDGTFRHGFFHARYQSGNGAEVPNLRVAYRIGVLVTDQHGNPISNFRVAFGYRPDPVPFLPPPTITRHRPPNKTPGKLVRAGDYLECIRSNPAPRLGECTEADSVLVSSSSVGAYAYAALGDCWACYYFFDVGTPVQPTGVNWIGYATQGYGCLNATEEACSNPRDIKRPFVQISERPQRVNSLANLIEAYPLGDEGPIQLAAEALSEKERIVQEVGSDGTLHYYAEGTNQWRRERLADAEIDLTPATPGTAVSPITHVGDGVYAAAMTMSPTPQRNTVGYRAKLKPLDIPYLPGTREVDPRYVSVGAELKLERQPKGPVIIDGTFSLWGVKAEINRLMPSPVLLDERGVVARSSQVAHEILPENYRLLLAPTDVRFDLERNGGSVAAAHGTEGQSFEIPAGLYFPPGQYSARVSVLGVSADGRNIGSAPFPVTACNLLALETETVVRSYTEDLLNDFICRDDGQLVFALCRDARVTLTIDGQPVSAMIDGSAPQPITDLPLTASAHAITLPGDLFPPDLDSHPFVLRAVDASDPTLITEAPGVVVSALRNRAVLPVGRTFVKGVDLFDGHLVQQATDIKLPGRHLGLEATRTYASSGKSPVGLLGAGWGFNYASSLNFGECDLVNVTTADGSSQVFRTSDAGQTFQAQKGYHTRLVKNGDNSFDFFDKSGNRHHFREPEDPSHPHGDRRLEYVEEPHGDRIVLGYDPQGRVVEVAEVHPESGRVRSLEITYVRVYGFDRVVRIASAAHGLQVDYEYDSIGNLVKITRSGKNLAAGGEAAPRVHGYEYYEALPTAVDRPDRHQLRAAIDPNGNRIEYRYYTRADAFPGESSSAGGAVLVPNKEEYVKEVVEFPERGQSRLQLVTRFRYDVSETQSRRWQTTVRDARGHETLYVLNGNGSPLEIHEPLGKTTVMTWPADDILKTSERDANGRVTEFGYDTRGNLTLERILTSDVGPVATEYRYDERFNKLTYKKDAEGRETSYGIDAATGDLLEALDGVSNRTRYLYDNHGRLTSTTDPRGHATTHRSHDSFGNAGEIEDPLGNVTTRAFDLRGRLTQQTDTMGHDTQQTWDGLDRLVRTLRVAGGDSDDEVQETAYYPGGELRQTTNANGASTTYTIDGLSRVVATETSFDGQSLTTTTTWDANGNKETEKDRREVVRRFVYDELNRVTAVEIVTGLQDESPTGVIAEYGYDLVGNKTSETNLAGLTTRFEYDGLYRVKAKILPETMAAGFTPAGPLTERYGYDKVGNRTSVTDPNGHVTSFLYDNLNRPIRTTNALGQVTLASYDDPEGSHVNKSEEQDLPRGLRTTFLYEELNREKERRIHLEPDAAVDASVPRGVSYTTTTTYDDAAHSLTVTDPRGTPTVTRLDGLDRPFEQTVDPDGLALVTQMSYDGLGNRKSVTDPNAHTTHFRHDGLGRLVETTDARAQTASMAYDGEGLKTSETDRRGVTRSFSYDNLGRPRKSTLVPVPEMSGVPWSQEIRYQDVARKRIEIDALGHATTFDLDGIDRVKTETDALTHFRTFVWDGVNKREETDKRRHKTLFEYDALNRLTKTTDPSPFDNQTVETAFEDALLRTTTKDRRGFLTRTQTDPLGRVATVTRALGTPDEAVLERNTYDGNGNKTLATDAEGKKTRFEYDAANRLKAREDGFESPDAAVTTFVYDKASNLLEERDARAAALAEPWSVKRTYDELNRLETETDGEANVTRYGYDGEGNRTSVQTPKGQTTLFDYDELGKLTKVTQPVPVVGQSNPVTAYRYDPNRNRIRQTDANGHVVTMEYDELNRLKKTVQDPPDAGSPSPLNLITEATRFDENGNPEVMVDPKGQTITSSYDELNRLKAKTYAFATADTTRPWRYTASVDYGYDANGNLLRTDEHVASGTSPPDTILTTTRIYDGVDRLKSETQPLPDGGSRTLGYSYFKNGTRQTVTDPDNRVTRYSYDGKNRLQTAVTDFGTPDAKTTGYSYWPDDLLKTVTYPNGVTATHAYDKADRLLSLTNAKAATVISSYEYSGLHPTTSLPISYDANGNRLIQIETNGAVTETTTYSYDDLDRLASVTYPVDTTYPSGRVVRYEYDAVGNRIRETEKDSADAILADKQGVFDNANRLTELTDLVALANSTSFTWDKNGNQLTKTTAGVTTENRYDLRDKLVEVVQDASTLGRFQYDPQGRRNLKIGEEGLRQYVYDQTSLLTEYDASGIQKAKYDYGSDRLISLTRNDEGRRYFSLDGLRSVVNLTDDDGAAVASYHLDAWGNFRFPVELTQSANRFAFTGHIFDTETGLYNAKARYFDPKLGRFLTQDSFLGQIDAPPSLHRYAYANANPTRFIDPTGHAGEAAFMWAYGIPQRRLAEKIEAGERYIKEKGGEIGMGISIAAANFLKALNSPGHMTPEYEREYYLQPQTPTEKLAADVTDIGLTAAPLLTKALPRGRASTSLRPVRSVAADAEVEVATAKAAPTGTVIEDAASGGTKAVETTGIPEPQPPVSAPRVSKRQLYMGKTPGKGSKTGREVIERMKAEGRIVEAEDGTLQVRCPGGDCVDMSATDMSHLDDAVKYWNREGYKQGPKSEPVREFMRDPENYELEPSKTNRSRGARMPDRYRGPEPKPAPQPTPQPKPPEEER